ncbi:MAG: methyl-accepting chemotaxis protein [Cocleimonas sp.]|nr:methyl-accepting chemotaxis protein [Cocleimonas sp.]
MFNFEKLNLRTRLGLLVFLPIILTLIFGSIVVLTLDDNKKTLDDLVTGMSRTSLAGQIVLVVLAQTRTPLLNIQSNKITWSEGHKILTQSRATILEKHKQLETLINDNNLQNNQQVIAINKTLPIFLSSFDDFIKIIQSKNSNHLGLAIREEMQEYFNPYVHALTKFQEENEALMNNKVESTTKESISNKNIILSLLAFTLFLLALLGYLVFRSISKQTNALTSTIDALNRGNKSARTRVSGDHELAQLGEALNQLLDERDMTDLNIQKENEILNTSVFSLLESVADLSERNLTVRATVTEDATGPLADAINQLAIDTSDVLKKVRNIALTVESTSQTVDEHTTTVKELAESERLEAEQTSEAVSYLIERLDQIAQSSVSANKIANKTTAATEKAYQSVSKTVDSMANIRDTVQETGKRIKRLGERSQEITHIIDLINTITERTTILALNASMQALSAGEAGKGFSVIAEEIQRLAESSRESTDQIANLIKNIQQETRTTISTMDNTIEQVITGSSLAEEASAQMQLTLNATNKLTHSVESIAQASKEQVAISNKLQTRASEILKATQTTGQKMDTLGILTKDMVNNTQALVQSVNVFTLEENKIVPKRASNSSDSAEKQLVSNG